MSTEKKTTAPVSSVGADGEQPDVKLITEIIANPQQQINQQAAEKLSAEQNSVYMESKSSEQSGHGGLDTVSMTELYETIYPPRIPVVDGFLYGGTYLFVGAPKVGKSFFMGQLSYHVAMGIP